MEQAEKRKVVKGMADLIIHRGPDQDDYFVDDDMALGFRRLSIIDLDGGGQPIYNEDKTKVLVYNGEIYNYQVLREDLIAKGHLFSTKTDSEVLLHGYEEYGQEFLQKLRGMYAFVIWDTVEKKPLAHGIFSESSPFTITKRTACFFSDLKSKVFWRIPASKKP